MSLVEASLKKLDEKQLKYCKTASVLIDKARKKDIGIECEREVERESKKLRGYLECLADMRILSKVELKSLYLWFFTGNRLGKEN